MAKTLINYTALFVVLLLAQALVFDHLVLWHCAMAMVFVYLYIRMPMSASPVCVMSVGLAMGFFTDMFADTAGMNMLASVLLCASRPAVFRLYAPHEDGIEKVQPTTRTMGTGAYLKYAFTMVLLYCVLVYTVEAFGFFDPAGLLLRICASTAFTFLVILAVGSVKIRAK